MGIEDIQISEELETNAPSIKYSGNEGPKSPQEMQQMMIASLEEEYAKYKFDMLEQGLEPMSLQQFIEQAMAEGQMAGGQPTLPDRQMAAYGGIMGADGRKQYGIGSFFQKAKDKFVDDIIPNEIKNNPLLTAAIVAGGVDLTRGDDSLIRKGLEGITSRLPESIKNIPEKTREFIFEKDDEGKSIAGNIGRSIATNIVPIVGGIGAGLFTKNTESDNPGLPSDDTALNLADYKKAANLLDQKQGLAADMNFLPTVASRKYSPEEMAITYAQAANGGRIGFDNGGGIINPFNEFETFKLKNLGYDVAGKGTEPFGGESVLRDILRVNRANGGRMGFEEGGGIMDLGGMEKDYRAEGGFVPIGREEKADDVPARLSVNEFVFTADAVRNAGGGDIDQGAQVMENMMKHLEQGGQVSEESQGMAGARDMFATSERLSEVI